MAASDSDLARVEDAFCPWEWGTPEVAFSWRPRQLAASPPPKWRHGLPLWVATVQFCQGLKWMTSDDSLTSSYELPWLWWHRCKWHPPLLHGGPPSLDRHRRLIGMRPGTRFFIYGMNGLEILLQMPTSTHGLTSLAKHVASLPEHRWVQRLLSWHRFGTRRVGRPRNTWDSILDANCRYANLRYWRDAAFDNSLWNSHLGSFVDFCRM